MLNVAGKEKDCWPGRREEEQELFSRKFWNGAAAELAANARQSCSDENMIAIVHGRPEASSIVSIALAVYDTAASTKFNHVAEPLSMEASVDSLRMAGN